MPGKKGSGLRPSEKELPEWRSGAFRHKNTPEFSQEFRGEHIVGRSIWPPRSPDFTPPDYFLWEFLKERVYSNKPRSLGELKLNTEQTAGNTDPETLRKVTGNTLRRVDACLREGGGHF
jgi:hypothetical protein